MKKEIFEKAMQNIDDDLIEEAGALRAQTAETGGNGAEATGAITAGRNVPERRKARGSRSGRSFSGPAALLATFAIGFIVTAVVISVVNIRKGRSEVSGPATSTNDPEDIPSTDASDVTVWNGLRFAAAGVPVLPDANTVESPLGEGYLYRGAKNYTCSLDAGQEDDFYNKLKQAGFTVFQTTYGAFIYSDSCLVLQEGTPRDYAEAIDCGTDFVPEEGKTAVRLTYFFRDPDQEAKALYLGGISAGSARSAVSGSGVGLFDKALPIDVSPDGFTEKTGGQVFLVPLMSTLTLSGLPDQIDVFPAFCYFADGKAVTDGSDRPFVLTADSAAYADVDGDGSKEVLFVRYGSTSGVCSYEFYAFDGAVRKYAFTLIANHYTNALFTVSDGKLKVSLDELVLSGQKKTLLLDIGMTDGKLVLSDGSRTFGDGDVIGPADQDDPATPVPATPLVPATEGSTPAVTPAPTPTPEPTSGVTPDPTPTPEPTPGVTPDPLAVPFTITQDGKTIVPYYTGKLSRTGDVVGIDMSVIRDNAPDVYFGDGETWSVTWNGAEPENYDIAVVQEKVDFYGNKTTEILDAGLGSELSSFDTYLPHSPSFRLYITVVVKIEGEEYAYVFCARSGNTPAPTPTADPSGVIPIEYYYFGDDLPSTIFVGEPVKLEYTVRPANYNVGTIRWKIYEGGEYAVIDYDAGTITGTAVGRLTLECYVDGVDLKPIYKSVYVETRQYSAVEPETELDARYRPDENPAGLSNDDFANRKYYIVYNAHTPEKLPSVRYSPYVGDLTLYVKLDGLSREFNKEGVKVSFYNEDREYVGYSYTNSAGVAMFTVKMFDNPSMYFYIDLHGRESDTSPDSTELRRISNSVITNYSEFEGGFGKSGVMIYYKFRYEPAEADGIYTVRFVDARTGELLNLNDEQASYFGFIADYRLYSVIGDRTDPDTGERTYYLYSYPGLANSIVKAYYCPYGGSYPYYNPEETEFVLSPYEEGIVRNSYKVDGSVITVYLDERYENY